MTTHEDALRAAFKAVPDEWNCRKSHLEVIENCIAAYLSALLPEDVAWLAEPLSMSMFVSPNDMIARLLADRTSAASLIQSQAARIAEMEAGLLAAEDGTMADCLANYRRIRRSVQDRRALLNKDGRGC